MKCPNCQNELHNLSVLNKFGQKLEFSKCPHCRSFWFKKMRLYGFPDDKASEFDTPGEIDITANLVCPEDQTPLIDFKDPNVPPEFIGFRCSQCGGMFVPKSQLLFYKKYQMGGKAYMDMPRKTAVALVSLGTFFLLNLLFLAYSEITIRADVASYSVIQSSIWNYRTIAFILAFVLLAVIIIMIIRFFKSEKKD